MKRPGGPAPPYLYCIAIIMLMFTGVALWASHSGLAPGLAASSQPQDPDVAWMPEPRSFFRETISATKVPNDVAALAGPNQVVAVYKHYFVANSSVPGAGLGVYARTDLPKGLVWNPEDAEEGAVLTISRPQWDALLAFTDSLTQAGISQHAMHEFLAFLRRYKFYCPEADLLVLSLTHSTLTNHARSSRVKVEAGAQAGAAAAAQAATAQAAAASSASGATATSSTGSTSTSSSKAESGSRAINSQQGSHGPPMTRRKLLLRAGSEEDRKPEGTSPADSAEAAASDDDDSTSSSSSSKKGGFGGHTRRKSGTGTGRRIIDSSQQQTPNSGNAFTQGCKSCAQAEAAEHGEQPPSLVHRCVLVRTQQPVKAGEELLEDYGTWECPWPRCNHPEVGWYDQPPAGRQQQQRQQQLHA